ncbi:hypothetical protein [Ancylobacter lacus]|uniref:hypothetical protein n=1 Tax=Ancylobacter lacus TaxID=2579970 RepID=UPI001BCE6ECA|nr:hypothetical protein [Ancylobacter lacus]MBS7538112.1 hypothetical protein [Ancylobacter lacus]
MRIFALPLFLFLACAGAPAQAAEPAPLCPFMTQPEALPTLGDLRRQMPKGDGLDDPARLAELVDTFRRDGAAPGTVVDHLIAAHCPAIANDPALGGEEKARRLRQFAARVAAAVYGWAPDDRVIVDLALPPATLEAAASRARESGQSLSHWLESAVTRAAGTP